MVKRQAVEPIANANLELRKLIEHIQLGQSDAVNTAHFAGLPHEAGIEPAAAARSPRDRAELLAPLAEELAGLILELGRERSFPYPRGVGLGDAQHVVDRARPEPRAGRGLRRYGVRRGDKGIGAVVDIEQGALRTFEKDALALPAPNIEQRPHRVDIRQGLWFNRRNLAAQRLAANLMLAKPATALRLPT